MAIGLVTEQALHKWAMTAGVISEGEHARKLTLVMEVGEPTRVTVERYGDEKILQSAAPDLSGVDVAVEA